MERLDLHRLLIIGVLVVMVVRSVAWLIAPWEHPDASQGRYALNIVTVVICGLTAWATWRPGSHRPRSA